MSGRWTTGGGGGQRVVDAPGRLVGADEGKHGGVARQGRGGKGEKGVGLAQRAGKEKKGGPTAQRHVEEESVGGPGGRQGARPAEAVAGRASAV
jgi:hypothetical protein